MLSRRKDFQQATCDFVQLLNINWRQGLTCVCTGGPTQMTMDGMVMGIRLNRVFLQQPWLPPADAPVVRGNTMASRVLLPDPYMRRPYCALVAGQPAGYQSKSCTVCANSCISCRLGRLTRPNAASCHICCIQTR